MRDYINVRQTLPAGQQYAGLILGKNNCRDHHLALLPEEVEEVPWGIARDWALSCGGELPTRRELALLYANLHEHFQRVWYWSCETQEPRAHLVWGQNFNSGIQTMYGRPYRGRARAVLRVPVE